MAVNFGRKSCLSCFNPQFSHEPQIRILDGKSLNVNFDFINRCQTSEFVPHVGNFILCDTLTKVLEVLMETRTS